MGLETLSISGKMTSLASGRTILSYFSRTLVTGSLETSPTGGKKILLTSSLMISQTSGIKTFLGNPLMKKLRNMKNRRSSWTRLKLSAQKSIQLVNQSQILDGQLPTTSITICKEDWTCPCYTHSWDQKVHPQLTIAAVMQSTVFTHAMEKICLELAKNVSS